MKITCLLLTLLTAAFGFAPVTIPSVQRGMELHMAEQREDDNIVDNHNHHNFIANSRRDFLSSSAMLLSGMTVAATTTTFSPLPAQAASEKVLVLGETGFVGSQVISALQAQGVSVISTSRDGRLGTEALDFTNEKDIQKKVKELSQGCTAVISCIGSIGTPNDEIVNAGTGYAAAGAKEAGVDRFVYISVAPEVKEFAKDIDFLKGYMAGKTYSQDAIVSKFQQYTLIEPTFIYGGDEFKVNPPRVASFYGNFVEGVLSSGPLRALTNVAPEGFIKIALEPPVPVEAVANAAVAGALAKTGSKVAVLDTYDKIKETAGLLI